MAERFQKLFSLPPLLYTESAPVLLAAGALQKDSQTGKVIGQLKFRSISPKQIRGLKTELQPLDMGGRPLGEPLSHSYLDLQAARDADFGQQEPIFLPNAEARSIQARATEVFFADGSSWAAPVGADWEPLPATESLESGLGDGELVKQYKIRYGEKATQLPLRHGNLWLCACGAVNRADEPRCHRCSLAIDELLGCDLQELTREKDERLAREKAEREAAEKKAIEEKVAAEKKAAEEAEALAKLNAERAEKAKARRKKAGKIASIAAGALMVAALVLLGIPGLSALQAGKAAGGGDYISAVEKYRSAAGWGLFNALFHPVEKADALIPAAHYQEGEAALAEGRIEDALAAFEAAGDYEDAAERRVDALSGAIEAYSETGELEKAETLLVEVPAGDEQARLAALLAGKMADQGEYRRAYELFQQSRQKPEDEELWAACCATAVREYAAEGDIEAALGAKNSYPRRVGNSEMNELNLILAESYLQAGDYKKARNYAPDKAFQDAELEARRQEARYQIGLGLYRQGSYVDARIYLEGSYKDSEHYYALCQVGDITERANKGDYVQALSVARDVDESKLTEEERGAYHDVLYSAATKAKNSGDYASAFALYRFSQTKDHQAQMDLCNEKYITTPRTILTSPSNTILGNTAVSIYHGLGSYGQLNDVRCTYSKGQFTFTLYYTANRSLEWYVWSGPDNRGSYHSVSHGTVKTSSSSVSFTISYSALTNYNRTDFELFYVVGNIGYSDIVYLKRSDLDAFTLDLYGNPIP